ncbi:MAG TPA: glycosyltransferase family 2 protein [Acidobacteriaceae bacterium]|jgi:glycosyltransferase involved in cell wall biosynthesis
MPGRVSVIIPALNEAESIGFVVGSQLWDEIAECIVVDNGSTDETALVAMTAGARVIRAPRGYGSAMRAGAGAASPSSDILLFMDGDGSDVPADMPLLVGPIQRGEADFVLGSRLANREPGSMLASQVFASHLISFLVRLFYGHRYSDMASMRAIRREALEAMDMRERTYGWNLEMQIKAVRNGLRIAEVPVNYKRRIGGVSKVSGDFKASVKAGFRILSVFLRVRREA